MLKLILPILGLISVQGTLSQSQNLLINYTTQYQLSPLFLNRRPAFITNDKLTLTFDCTGPSNCGIRTTYHDEQLNNLQCQLPFNIFGYPPPTYLSDGRVILSDSELHLIRLRIIDLKTCQVSDVIERPYQPSSIQYYYYDDFFLLPGEQTFFVVYRDNDEVFSLEYNFSGQSIQDTPVKIRNLDSETELVAAYKVSKSSTDSGYYLVTSDIREHHFILGFTLEHVQSNGNPAWKRSVTEEFDPSKTSFDARQGRIYSDNHAYLTFCYAFREETYMQFSCVQTREDSDLVQVNHINEYIYPGKHIEILRVFNLQQNSDEIVLASISCENQDQVYLTLSKFDMRRKALTGQKVIYLIEKKGCSYGFDGAEDSASFYEDFGIELVENSGQSYYDLYLTNGSYTGIVENKYRLDFNI